ncbi:MAG: dockerin type I repeat-containing protein, partial [Ruminococcus sp.]|nr:dockerin type I repeat-containing protein [Ruminococcus sp.]
DEVVYCTECGEEISREAKTIDMIAHTTEEAVKENEVPATCKAEGSYDEVVYCSECGEELSRETKTIDMIAHDIKFVEEVPATASVDGMRAHYECAVCGDLFSDAEGKQPVSAEDLVIKAEHLRGDANGDGVVDITDVTTIQRYLAEYEVPVFDETAADADLDGEVDIIDATLIQRVLLNICNWDKVPANA